MKNFLILLFKGIAITLATCFIVCFLAWFWGNWRAISWFVILSLLAWQVYKFLKGKQKCWILDGTDQVRYYTFSEKIDCILSWGFFFLIAGGCLWCIGWCIEWISDTPHSIFEYTIFKGGVAVISIAIFSYFMRIAFHSRKLHWKYFVPSIGCFADFAKWILVIGVSIVVAVAVLYYCLPPDCLAFVL